MAGGFSSGFSSGFNVGSDTVTGGRFIPGIGYVQGYGEGVIPGGGYVNGQSEEAEGASSAPIALPKEFTAGYSSNRKPTVPVEIDWDNPLTKDLIAYVAPTKEYPYILGSKESATAPFGAGDTFKIVPTTRGEALRTTADASTLLSEDLYTFFNADEDFTFFADVYVNDNTQGTSFIIGGDGTVSLGLYSTGYFCLYASGYEIENLTLTQNGNFYSVVASRRDGVLKIYVNGVEGYSDFNTKSAADRQLELLGWDGRYSHSGAIYLLSAGYSFRGWTEADVKAFYDNPYQILKPQIETLYFPATAGGGSCPAVSLVSDVTKGTLVLSSDGSFTYDYTDSGPYPDTDSFTYNFVDDNGTSNTATSTLTITSTAVDGNASGILSNISVTQIAGTALASALAIASLSPVNVSAIDGSADAGGNGVATGILSDVAISPIEGFATGSSTATGSLNNVNVTAIDGSSNGDSSALGDLNGTSVSIIEGSSTATALASGPLNDVLVSAIDGSANAGDNGVATGVLSNLSVSAILGSASGSSSTSGVLNDISVSNIDGSAYTVSYALGSLSNISVSYIDGTGTGNSSALGLLPDISVSAIDGSADAGSNGIATGLLSNVSVSTIDGSALGGITADASGILSNISVSYVEGYSSGSASSEGSLSDVVVTHIDGYAISGLGFRDTIRFSTFIKRTSREDAFITTQVRSNSNIKRTLRKKVEL